MLCASMATLLLIDITTTAIAAITASITAQPQLKCGTRSLAHCLSPALPLHPTLLSALVIPKPQGMLMLAD